MFYINFIIVILLVLLGLWTGIWLYKIHEIKHSAHILLGRLIRLYDKRHELIEKFINNKNFSSSDLSPKISNIITNLQLSRQKKDIYEKLKVEHEISEAIKDLELDNSIWTINKEIHDIVEQYNLSAEKIGKLNEQFYIRLLFKIFKIGLLNKIEV